MSQPARLKLLSFLERYGPYFGMAGIIIGGHLGWKKLQDVGIGRQGADYPHKRLYSVYSKKIKELMGKETDKPGQSDKWNIAPSHNVRQGSRESSSEWISNKLGGWTHVIETAFLEIVT